jgi:hypothetical protein
MALVTTIKRPFVILKDEEPPLEAGWIKQMEMDLCAYVLKDVVRLNYEFGFDLYLQNVNKAIPRSEFDNLRIRIFCKKRAQN